MGLKLRLCVSEGEPFSYPLGQFDSQTQGVFSKHTVVIFPWSCWDVGMMTLHMTAGGVPSNTEQIERGRVWAGPPGPAGGAGSISQRCSAWPLASFHASLLFQCKSEATQVLHLRYWVNMEIKPALMSCGHERNQQGTKRQVPLLPHRLQVGWNTQTTLSCNCLTLPPLLFHLYFLWNNTCCLS